MDSLSLYLGVPSMVILFLFILYSLFLSRYYGNVLLLRHPILSIMFPFYLLQGVASWLCWYTSWLRPPFLLICSGRDLPIAAHCYMGISFHSYLHGSHLPFVVSLYAFPLYHLCLLSLNLGHHMTFIYPFIFLLHYDIISSILLYLTHYDSLASSAPHLHHMTHIASMIFYSFLWLSIYFFLCTAFSK
jgi:hypothetical protein